MGFIRDLFKKIKTIEVKRQNITAEQNVNVMQLLSLREYMNEILQADRYIAKSEYKDEIHKHKDVIEFFIVLKNSSMLDLFCKKYSVDLEVVQESIDLYSNFECFVDRHNEIFVSNKMLAEKEYLDNILKTVDPKILLDDDQRKVILTDEDYCLVIAGAGAGKTTTVAAKVKYLVEKRKVDPAQILVVSFTNKAVNELKEKINDDLNIKCPIATFHSTGNAIIHKNAPDEKLNIVENQNCILL